MNSLLWTIPALPLTGFTILALFGDRLSRRTVSRLAVGTVSLSAIFALVLAFRFVASPPEGHAVQQSLWSWIQVGEFSVEAALRLDALSLVMVLVVTVVGALIHLYSTEYMADDESYTRFFAYLNLFVAAMLTLVLADNLLFLFLGWEGVGLCSYLLIGFWYEDPKNGRAAAKAFLVTRIGDAFMLIGMLLLFWHFGTLHIQTLLGAVNTEGHSWHATLAALFLLGGAIGKSGQVPLQVWLPDAMAGPTPVSALIHAATMVTAGVYLIARMNPVYSHAPVVQHIVTVIGAVTLLIAGLCALAQRDIKRVLAYSTISQIGYMFLALGVGAWSAAMFHLFTHAIFKALLFMAAGAIIVALHHEQDMFKMGGLRRRMPLVFWTYLIGSLSLAALPLVTAGFYSKDKILFEVYTSEHGGKLLWAAGVVGAFITALYTFRMIFLVFFGTQKTEIHKGTGLAMALPLILLAAGATFTGFFELPAVFNDFALFSRFIEHTLPGAHGTHGSHSLELILMATSTAAVLAGIALANFIWGSGAAKRSDRAERPLSRLLASGMGFDWIYDRAIVSPYTIGARANAHDAVNALYAGLVTGVEEIAFGLARTQSGRLRWYMAAIAFGAVIGILLVVYA
ncbi:MAG: NADH-quinone oxidoreductase subunit L [Candidatus Hydrogenedentes bacterium]|nr:NADH-quinone oxidoreductase subunit L [Candidatus Hydrogenedentota bacterium]